MVAKKKCLDSVTKKVHNPPTVGASSASSRRQAPVHHHLWRQAPLLKRIMGSERATGALAIVNHHSNRCRTLLAAFGGDRVGGIMVDYFPERMRTESSYFIQLCRRTHMWQGGWMCAANHKSARFATTLPSSVAASTQTKFRTTLPIC